MTYDIVTIGNAVVDFLFTLPPSDTRFRLDTANGEICLKTGRKIVADNLHVAAGGGAVRVGIALARMGHKSAIVAEVGNDPFAEVITKTLAKDGVIIEHILHTDSQTPATVGVSCQGERTLITNLPESDHAFDLHPLETGWIYLASLGDRWEEAYTAVCQYIDEKNVRLAFNPGPAQFLKGTASFAQVLQRTDVLFVNKEEAQQIIGNEEEDIKSLLQKTKATGPRVAVITDGTNGSYAIDEQGAMYHLAILPFEVVEKTGAGDAFASGFLAAFRDGKGVQEAMRWGTAHSASVVGKMGGHEGLLRKDEVAEMAQRQDMPTVEQL